MQDPYALLAERLDYAPLPELLSILGRLMSPEEALLLLELPGQPDELVQRLTISPDALADRLADLVRRGLVFPTRKGVRPCRDVEELHALTLAVAEQYVPDGVLDLWKEFYEADWCRARGRMYAELKEPLLKVVPARRALANSTGNGDLLPDEDLERLLQSFEAISVSPCPCRRALRRCQGPLQVCLSFNRGAQYIIDRGIGASLSVDEALAITDLAEGSGLVHCLDTRFFLSMCNCCSDCCLILDPGLRYGTLKQALARSSYCASINTDACIGCEDCVGKCPFSAIRMLSTPSGEAVAVGDPEKCFGCGLCVPECPSGAIAMIPRGPDSGASLPDGYSE